MRVLICGGGIGGLTAALSLGATGVEVRIFESSDELRALGVGINLLPHAVRVLTDLGLDGALGGAGIQTAELAYYSKHGQLIWAEPRGIAAGYLWPQYSIHRGRLLLLLRDAVLERLGPDVLRCGHHLCDFTDSGSEVRATFFNRRTGSVAARESGDVLIGADGIHSVVRAAFYPNEGNPKCSGRLLWRAVTEADPFLTGRSMIMAGHADQKFVCYPICPDAAARGRSLINWIAELRLGENAALHRRDWNRPGDKQAFAPMFRDWRFEFLDIPDLIERAGHVFEFPMADRDPAGRWSFGRVTLLGDAAHPMYPIGSNGASQAILDAEALARALGACRDEKSSRPLQNGSKLSRRMDADEKSR